MWRIFDFAAPSLELPPWPNSVLMDGYPVVSVKADSPISVEQAVSWLRDHYEGTPFDMTTGPSAGPYGDPARYDMAITGVNSGEGLYADTTPWLEGGSVARPASDATNVGDLHWGRFERAISCFRTVHAFAAVSVPALERASALVETVVWFSNFAPHSSAFSPVPVGVNEAPEPFAVGLHHRVDTRSAYWAHALVGNWYKDPLPCLASCAS